MPALFSFRVDDENRAVHIVSTGTWAIEDVDRYSREFNHHVAIARERFGDVRMLVDGREAVTQEAEVGRRLGRLAALFDRPGDRFAVVTPTSLRKQQATREALPVAGMAFISIDAARTWLFAHD